MIALVYGVIFLSGAAALIAEVAWVRLLTGVFGNTTYATSTVLAAFMGGLALGSYGFGRRADVRGVTLRTYAALELGIGAFALATPWAFSNLSVVYAPIFRGFGAPGSLLVAVQFALALAVLIVPTTLMGATLPVLSKAVIRHVREAGSRVGGLYGINTLGATVGCVLAGFLLLFTLGVTRSIVFASLLNFASAVGAFLLSRRLAAVEKPEELSVRPHVEAGEMASDPRIRLVFIALAVSGFTALAYEVLWTRLLVFALGQRGYAFALMLGTFLAGIALGSLLMARWLRSREARLDILGVLEVAIGVWGVCTLTLFGQIPDVLAWLRRLIVIDAWANLVLLKALVAALVILPPTLLFGATFPLATRLTAHHVRHVGRAVGRVYAWNTVGGIAGSCAVGFALVPVMGTHWTMITIALVNVVIGVWVAGSPLAAPRRRPMVVTVGICVVASVALTVAVPGNSLDSLFGMNEPGSRLVYLKEGPAGTVSVHQYANHRVLSAGGVNVAGSSFSLRTTQKLQAHVPMLLHPNPRRVLHIGFGTGETAHGASLYPVERIDVVEINPDVIHAALRFFPENNRGVLNDPRLRRFIMDGKNYLELTDQTYDVILNDSIYPGFVGSSGLYGENHFLAAREHLAPHGVISSWIPLDLTREAISTILRSFQTVFPHTSLWLATNHLNRHLLLVGTLDPVQVDLEAFERRFFAHAEADLAPVGLGDPYPLLDSYFLGEEACREFAGDGPTHSDDLPILEFLTGRTVTDRRVLWAKNLEELLPLHRPVTTILADSAPGGPSEDHARAALVKRTAASGHLLEAMWRSLAMKSGVETAVMEALKIDPEHQGAQLFFRNMVLAKREAPGRAANATEYVKRGIRFAQLGEPDKAIAEFEAALRLEPGFADAHSNLGVIYHQKGWTERAIAEFETAIELRGPFPEALYNLGRAYESQGMVEEAVAAYEEAVALRPDNWEAYGNLGLLFARTGRREQAIAMLEKVLEIKPGNPIATRHLRELRE